jgi:hypothetical protein
MARKKKVEITTIPQQEERIGIIEFSHDDDILNILSVFCDGLHELSGKTEPWRSIKQQIEALRK